MYRRVTSGRWIGITTAMIVVVMAVFTWVMYGMSQQVFTMTDVMLELNESIKVMVGTQVSMAGDMGAMSTNISSMNSEIMAMNQNIGDMTGSVGHMTDAIGGMAMNLNRITYDFSQATYAISNPMSYMWGNALPF